MSQRNRVDIAQMLAEKTPAGIGAAAAPTERKPPRSRPRERGASESAPATTVRPAPPKAAKWTQCEPHTFYVWPNSIDELQQLARRLQRARPKGQGERITMATLVRVAIARLVEIGDDLTGVDEAELLNSYRDHTHPKTRAAVRGSA